MEKDLGARGMDVEPKDKPIVGVIMGSDSDLPIMQEAAIVLEELKVPHEVRIISAHRTPDAMRDYAKDAYERGIRVIIAGAGGAAHLPGLTASFTNLPVIGVPIESRSLKGIDSLVSIVQMEPGVPVGTMAINGARNAGIFAAEVLANSDQELEQRLIKYKTELNEVVKKRDESLGILGFREYLKQMGN